MNSTKTFIACGLMALSLGSLPIQAADAPFEAIPRSDLQALSSAQADAIRHLGDYVAINAKLAGIASVCDPRLAEIIHECTELAVRNWNFISGLAPIDSATAAESMAGFTWQKIYNASHALQAGFSAPAPCDAVGPLIKDAPALSICEMNTNGGDAPPEALSSKDSVSSAPLKIQ